SSLVNFISETILLGFKAGAALTIAMTQLPKLFGVSGGGDNFFQRVWKLGSQIPDTQPIVLAFGVAAIALLVAGEKLLPARPVGLVFASATIALCLLFLTGLLRNLPDVVLAAIVLVAVKGLINIPELRRVWTLSRMEFGIAMAAFAGVLLLGILKGVLLAAIVSVLLLLHRAAPPPVARLGRVPGTRRYSDIDRNPD